MTFKWISIPTLIWCTNSKKEAKANPINEVVGNFIQEMKKVSKKNMEEKLDGIIIFIDEIDRKDMTKDFPIFSNSLLKAFLETILIILILFCRHFWCCSTNEVYSPIHKSNI